MMPYMSVHMLFWYLLVNRPNLRLDGAVNIGPCFLSIFLLKSEIQRLQLFHAVITDDLVYIKMHNDESTHKNVFRHNYVKLGFLINTIALDYTYMLKHKEK